jgi:hypothetical protein
MNTGESLPAADTSGSAAAGRRACAAAARAYVAAQRGRWGGVVVIGGGAPGAFVSGSAGSGNGADRRDSSEGGSP